MKLVIFGPQGAGKGTQGDRISERWDVPAIATGDLFRDAIAAESSLGKRVKEIVEQGQLVPDDLTVELVRQRLAEPDASSGWLLDGFPRTTEQARSLEGLLAQDDTGIDAALLLAVPEAVTRRRILGRRVCSGCGRNYHEDAPPAVNWTCDDCGGEVVQRPDDRDEAAVRHRLDTYYKETEPLGDYYDAKGLLRRIDGEGTPDEIFERIVSTLEGVSA